jgi:hypothetical protein
MAPGRAPGCDEEVLGEGGEQSVADTSTAAKDMTDLLPAVAGKGSHCRRSRGGGFVRGRWGGG